MAWDRAAIKRGDPKENLNFPDNAYNIHANPVRNKRKRSVRNTTGYTGVSKDRNCYKSRVRLEGKLYHVGTFASKKAAAIAYDRAVIQSGDMKKRLNFPKMIHNMEEEVEQVVKRRKKTKHTAASKNKGGQQQHSNSATNAHNSLLDDKATASSLVFLSNVVSSLPTLPLSK